MADRTTYSDDLTSDPVVTALPLLPTPAGVVFPDTVVTIALESEEADAVGVAAGDDQLVLVPLVTDRLGVVGTLAKVENRGRLRNGTKALTVRALRRVHLGDVETRAGGTRWVEIREIEKEAHSDELRELATRYRAVAGALLDELGARQFSGVLPDIEDPGALADTIAYWPELGLDQRVELLETVSLVDRLALATGWAEQALRELTLARTIRDEVSANLETDQREMLLRRQLAAIQKELGSDDADLIGDFRDRLAGLELADSVRVAITKEVDRLERVGDQGQEANWIRTWLDEVFALPWGKYHDEQLDLAAARMVLDADHTGLEQVKDRVIEHLAVRKIKREREVVDAGRRSSAILTLVGPPGVGKTSLGESVAAALGRPFVRLALGGIRDEAEIRGHRRTYVGARPGRLVRALTEAGSLNPVILLDEIDKIGSDYRGDPAAALLEVLDPGQNHKFRDHYLEFEIDLSDVVFIATANRLDTIPGPLLDRVEVISLDGYTTEEKVAIASNHLLPRLRASMGLREDEIVLDDEQLRRIVGDWTREPGVRNLERQLDKVLRKAVTRVLQQESDGSFLVREVHKVGDDLLVEWLGQPIPHELVTDRIPGPGVATGLAVTGSGGDVLFVEAAAMDGEPGLTLTGQLGDVMKESGEIARSYLRSHAAELGITDPDRRFHVHFPAGAVPKDGPSAGITMTTALVSLLTGRPVRPEVAMTGEVTLLGQVLPIGGVKQKLLAAHRAGIREVILPRRNEPDLDDVPDEVRSDLIIHLVDNVSAVVDLALVS